MHTSAMEFGKVFFETYCKDLNGKTVVDIGSQDVNGSLRDVCPSSLKYVGVDFVAGRNVDVVLEDPYKLPFEDNSVNVIVCSSVFEHSSFFWILFLEVIRILKPGGLFYMNAPSNGNFHQYPLDCWRFYPDAGHALVSFAEYNKQSVTLIESFVGKQDGHSGWNDFVAVFAKEFDGKIDSNVRMVNNIERYFNGYSYGREGILNRSELTQDHLIIANLKSKLLKNRIRKVRKAVYRFAKAALGMSARNNS